MKLFSERYNYIKVADVIIREKITPEIQNAICSCYDKLQGFFIEAGTYYSDTPYIDMEKYLWTYFLNQREGNFYEGRRYHIVATQFVEDENNPWYRKLDLIELTVKYLHALDTFNYYFIENPDQLGNVAVGNLTQIASYTNGLAMQRFRPNDYEVGLPVLKIKELGQNTVDSASDKCTHDIDDIYKVFDGDVIFSWSGTLMVKVWTGGECGLNQHLFKVTSNEYPKWYYYFWTKHHLNKFIRIAKDKAVTMGQIKRGELEKAEVLIPCTEMLSQIDYLINPLFEKSIECSLENRNLTTLRDSLLPKLMSGELKISEIETEK